MNQNLATLNLTDSQIAAVDAALTELETALSGLVSIDPSSKSRAFPMGDKSEAFCRQALRVLSENPQVVPPNMDVAEALRDLDARDRLKPRSIRLSRLLSKMDDTEFALGADAMQVATQGYALLKVVGRSEGLAAFRKDLAVRFNKTRRVAVKEKAAA